MEHMLCECRRNKHGVPRSSIERMLEKYEHRLSVERILNSERPSNKTTPSLEKTAPTEQAKER